MSTKTYEATAGAHTITMCLRFFALFVFTGFAVSIGFHYIQGHVLHRGYPWNTYLFDPSDRFNDWHNSVASARTSDPYFKNHVAISAYFPFAYITFLVGAPFGHRTNAIIFLAVSLALFAFSYAAYWKVILTSVLAVRRVRFQAAPLIAAILLFCYPLHMALDRGNIDAWIAPLCLLYVLLLRTRFANVGSAALGVAIAFKGYPAALVLLAVADRRYWQAALPLAISLLLTIFALLCLSGGVQHNVAGLQAGLRLFQSVYVVGDRSMRYSSDPYHVLQYAALRWRLLPIVTLLKLYHVLSFEFACICAYFGLFVPAKRWQHVTAVCLGAMLFPDAVNDYKLLMLLPGLLLLIADGEDSRSKRTASFCFAGLLIPKQYLYDHGGVSISTPINALLLLVLAASVLTNRDAWSTAFRQTPARLAWYLAALPHGLSVCRRLPFTEIQLKQGQEMVAL
jgi:hypothetical protein